LLDRIDLHLAMHNEPFSFSAQTLAKPDSREAAAQVARAHACQLERQGRLNAHLDLGAVRQHCRLTTEDERWLEQAVERLGLSRRASHRALKVARTLADLGQQDRIGRAHLAEALQYRQLDRQPAS